MVPMCSRRPRAFMPGAFLCYGHAIVARASPVRSLYVMPTRSGQALRPRQLVGPVSQDGGNMGRKGLHVIFYTSALICSLTVHDG
jgi:hypothetical protein